MDKQSLFKTNRDKVCPCHHPIFIGNSNKLRSGKARLATTDR
ncbi:MAG: hypothetical protein QY310_05665 [Candidatus Jettenia sp. CY-1]|nr:MAG: hypothetical protein QY310_05665 [Candidatus Jettenia sp. CY-1]